MDAQPLRLLVIDDDRAILSLIGSVALTEGFDVSTCTDVGAALPQLRQHPADLVLLDVGLPQGSDLDALRAVRDVNAHCTVVLTTGSGHLDAVEAVRLGAADILTKPFDLVRLRGVLRHVRGELEARRAVLLLERLVAERLEFYGMIGRGAAMQHVFEQVRRFANHASTVLVTGEAGTGKDLAARALHQLGPRAGRRLTVLNCTLAHDPAFERQLFGHARGAFPGAAAPTPGLIEASHGGTLFLDEVADLPLTLQGRLLRVLQAGEVQRLGSAQTRPADVWVIAATRRDLRVEMLAGRFLEELYQRLSGVEIALPPLRERREDVPYLTAAFIRACAQRFSKRTVGLTPDAEQLLAGAAWHGNVRELRHVLERACLRADGDYVTHDELASVLREQQVALTGSPPVMPAAAPLPEAGERELIMRTLQRVHGNKAVAARLLGISRRAFYRQLERHGLHQPAPAPQRVPAARAPSMEQV